MRTTASPRRRVGLLLAVAFVALAALVAGCGDSSESSGSSGTGTSASDGASSGSKKVSFVAAFMAANYFQMMQCGAQDAAEEYGVDLKWQGPAQWDLQQQMPMVNAAMQTKPDGLILVPTDPKAMIQPVANAMKAGTPVITVDGNLEQPVEVQNLRTDNVRAGALAADEVARAVGERGKVLIVALAPGVSANTERVDGFTRRIEEAYPDIELLPTQYSGSDQGKASQLVSSAITANSDLAAVYTTLAPASSGAAAAIQAAGKQGDVKLVAYDADPVQVANLKKGVFDALVAQDPYGEGYESVALMARILDGEVDQESVERQTYTGAFVITRENVDTPEAQRAAYKAKCE
jgi:ribose transport system substrate-binding protein